MTTIEALEKVWIAEINGSLPFQSKAAIYKRLVEQSLLDEMVVLMGLVTVRGYQLSHAGRCLYCSSCGNG